MSQASFDELLQCSICLERFTQPKLLPCSHTFCLSCLKGIIQDAKTVDCPTCRRTHQVPEQGPAGFHDNLMAAHLLSMYGEINECADCGKKQSLSECEHCKLQVCGDCRVAHNVLLAEINVLIGVIQHDILQRPREDLIKTACGILERADAIETLIHQVFNEAIETLDLKKTHLLQQVGNLTKFQTALSQGNTDAIVKDMDDERRNRQKVCDLSAMKENLTSVIRMMNIPDWDMEFEFNFDEVSAFGKVNIIGTSSAGGRNNSVPGSGLIDMSASLPGVDSTTQALETKTVTKRAGTTTNTGSAATCIATAAVGDVEVQANHPSLASVRGAEVCGNEAAISLLPKNVDYRTKNACFHMQLVVAPLNVKFAPTSAVYSPKENAIYCISSFQVLKFDVKSGIVKTICSSSTAVDLAVTDSGNLMIAIPQGVKKLSFESLTHSSTNYDNVSQTLRLQGHAFNQLCCYGREFMILEYNKPCISKFNESGTLIGEYRLNRAPIDWRSEMCADQTGQVYIVYTCDGVEQNLEIKSPQCSTCETHLRSVNLLRRLTVTTVTWDGVVSGQLTLADHCHNCIGSYRVGGVCVDGDGFISVSRRGEQKVDVYDPKGKLHCSINIGDSSSKSDLGGLCTMPDGRMIVCDRGDTKRILII